MSNDTHPMTPLDAAQQIIDARARATAGVWYHMPECDDKYKLAVQTDRLDYDVGYDGIEPLGIGQTCQGDCADDFKFIALSANHAAAVAQAYKDAEKRVAELVELVEYWAKVISYESTASSNQMTEQLARIMGKETHDDA